MSPRVVDQSGAIWFERPSGLVVPRRYRRPVAIDLFAGAGGASVGVHQAGFHVVAALEFDPYAAITYMVNLAVPGVQIHFDTDERRRSFEKVLARHLEVKIDQHGHVIGPRGRGLARPAIAGSGWISHYGCTHPEHSGIGKDGKYNEYLHEINQAPVHPDGCEHFWVADARNVTGQEILDAIGLEQGEVDLVFGGPPCQGFSHANSKRTVMDPRNSLVFEFARLVLEIRPKAILMENVPGILDMVTPEGLPVVDALCMMLEDGGFGAFDALKRSLTAMPHARGAIAGQSGTRRSTDRRRAAEADDEAEHVQTVLF